MDICFEGIGQVAATFQVEKKDVDGIKPGMAVVLTGDGTVGLGNDGEMPCGVVLGGVRGGAAAVQIGGVAKVSCSKQENLTAGWQKLACDSEGGVKIAENGLNCLVLAVDKTEKTAVVKL